MSVFPFFFHCQKLSSLRHPAPLIVVAVSLLSLVVLPSEAQTYSWKSDLEHRICLDFNISRSDVIAYIRRYIPNVSNSQLETWERSGALEMRVINGEKRYFHNAASNLFRIDAKCRSIREQKDGPLVNGYETVDAENVPAILSKASRKHPWAEPKRLRVTYTLTVSPDRVPAGKMVRCWLPFPRRDVSRQQEVRLVSASEKRYVLAPDSCAHSSLYMERKAQKGRPTVFSETFEYVSYGCWYDLKATDIKPYDTSSALYRCYTSERTSHIVFTPSLRHLADSLTAGVRNPLLKARRIFEWVATTFPWASAREYSTIENIPEYVLENRHGDCGQVTLLFLTLCRISGIPARFESGFMMHPGAENLHDWGEIFFEGIGWVPVDTSFGIPSYAKSDAERYFFFGGIDSWRMVVNSDFGKPLYPAKRYPRSETVDFQRGEAEWEGGNLYFDDWTWKMEVAYE